MLGQQAEALDSCHSSLLLAKQVAGVPDLWLKQAHLPQSFPQGHCLGPGLLKMTWRCHQVPGRLHLVLCMSV